MPLPRPPPRGTEEQPGRRPLRARLQGCFFSSRAEAQVGGFEGSRT